MLQNIVFEKHRIVCAFRVLVRDKLDIFLYSLTINVLPNTLIVFNFHIKQRVLRFYKTHTNQRFIYPSVSVEYNSIKYLLSVNCWNYRCLKKEKINKTTAIIVITYLNTPGLIFYKTNDACFVGVCLDICLNIDIV